MSRMTSVYAPPSLLSRWMTSTTRTLSVFSSALFAETPFSCDFQSKMSSRACTSLQSRACFTSPSLPLFFGFRLLLIISIDRILAPRPISKQRMNTAMASGFTDAKDSATVTLTESWWPSRRALPQMSPAAWLPATRSTNLTRLETYPRLAACSDRSLWIRSRETAAAESRMGIEVSIPSVFCVSLRDLLKNSLRSPSRKRFGFLRGNSGCFMKSLTYTPPTKISFWSSWNLNLYSSLSGMFSVPLNWALDASALSRLISWDSLLAMSGFHTCSGVSDLTWKAFLVDSLGPSRSWSTKPGGRNLWMKVTSLTPFTFSAHSVIRIAMDFSWTFSMWSSSTASSP
mmetsp:Transcript_9714/g.34655  ORF Transcript_9714/g.34655 Transcript_9714/m.34655 type:complete len:343 (+) Transcript_9714:255-1283(+)